MTRDGRGEPFAIGKSIRSNGFVHVLSDRSLDLVMREVDTVTDFVTYLSDKEELILAGKLDYAASEEDLLAYYRFPDEDKDSNKFVLPAGTPLTAPSGTWDAFERDPFRITRQHENKISYLWDGLVETLSEQVLGGGQGVAPAPTTSDAEIALRMLVRESRFRRRSRSIEISDVIRGIDLRAGYALGIASSSPTTQVSRTTHSSFFTRSRRCFVLG